MISGYRQKQPPFGWSVVRNTRQGSLDEQQQLESDRPLHGVDEVAVLVHVGNDAAAGFVLDVQIAPLAPGELVEQVLPRTVGRDRHRIAEQDRARIGGQVRVAC